VGFSTSIVLVTFFWKITSPKSMRLSSLLSCPILFLSFPGVGITLPFTINFITLFSALEVIVIDLLNLPGLFSDLYKTLTKPFSSGLIEPVDQLVIVHPQDALTLISFNGSSLVFEKKNSYSYGPSSSLISPKS
jgi:hypothetical protein